MLTVHRGPLRRADKLAARQLVQAQLDVARVAAAHLGKRARPETFPTTEASCSRLLFSGGSVSSRAAISDCTEPGTSALADLDPPVGNEADELLGIERIASGAFEQRALRLRRQHGALEQAANRRAVSSSESGARLIVVALPSPRPIRLPLEQLGARRAEHEQRHTLGLGSESLEEREHRVVRPVQVLEDEDGPRPAPTTRDSAARQ